MRIKKLVLVGLGVALVVVGSNAASAAPIAVAEPQVTATIAVGSNPFKPTLNAAGTTPYVANDRSATVSVIDTKTNSVTATIPVGQNPIPPVLNTAEHVYM